MRIVTRIKDVKMIVNFWSWSLTSISDHLLLHDFEDEVRLLWRVDESNDDKNVSVILKCKRDFYHSIRLDFFILICV